MKWSLWCGGAALGAWSSPAIAPARRRGARCQHVGVLEDIDAAVHARPLPYQMPKTPSTLFVCGNRSSCCVPQTRWRQLLVHAGLEDDRCSADASSPAHSSWSKRAQRAAAVAADEAGGVRPAMRSRCCCSIGITTTSACDRSEGATVQGVLVVRRRCARGRGRTASGSRAFIRRAPSREWGRAAGWPVGADAASLGGAWTEGVFFRWRLSANLGEQSFPERS